MEQSDVGVRASVCDETKRKKLLENLRVAQRKKNIE